MIGDELPIEPAAIVASTVARPQAEIATSAFATWNDYALQRSASGPRRTFFASRHENR
jgi:hypothetical protein